MGIVWFRKPVWSFLGDKYEGAYAQVWSEDKWGNKDRDDCRSVESTQWAGCDLQGYSGSSRPEDQEGA